MTHTHTFHLLSQSHPDPQAVAHLIAVQRNFRLDALQASPESFSSTYTREAAFIDSPNSKKSMGNVPNLIEGERKGSAVLFRPVPNINSTADGNKIPTFEILALFVLSRNWHQSDSVCYRARSFCSNTQA